MPTSEGRSDASSGVRRPGWRGTGRSATSAGSGGIGASRGSRSQAAVAGTPIPEANQCAVCHSGPHYTNQKLADVGSGKPTDRSPLVDVPQLTNIALTAPYLHDGSARTLEEIWTVFNPADTHGVTNDLQKDELNDLIEYLKTL